MPKSTRTTRYDLLRIEYIFALLCAMAVGGLVWSWPTYEGAQRPTPRTSLAQGAPRERVAVVVLGAPLAAADKAGVEESLRRAFGLSLRWLPRRSLPKEGWHPEFKRYRAARLCRQLARWRPAGVRWIIGITSVDISARQPGYKDHAVFGLADVRGPAAVLSVYRLSSLPPGERAAVWRRLLLHEVGHLFGLPHCATLLCPMYAAEGSLARLRQMHDRFCHRCARRLREER